MQERRITGAAGTGWKSSAIALLSAGPFDVVGHLVVNTINGRKPRQGKPTSGAVRWSAAGLAERSASSQKTVLIRNTGNTSQKPGCFNHSHGRYGRWRVSRSGFPHVGDNSLAVSTRGVVDQTASGTAVWPGISSCAQLGGGRDCFSEEGDRHVCRAQRDPPPGCCA